MRRTTPATSTLLAAGICTLLLGAGAAVGMVYAPISDADLLAGADLVVLGEVVAVRAASGMGVPALEYQVLIEDRVVLGHGLDAAPSTLTLRVPGGRREDGLAMWIPGTPRLQAGDRVLLFLSIGSDGQVRLSQHTLSLFHVVDFGGRKLAVRALGDAPKVFTAEVEGRADKGLSTSVARREEWPRDLDGFVGWLHATSEGTKADASYEVDPATLGPAFGDKYSLLVSRSDESFGSCGELGGVPVRRFQFDQFDTAGEPVTVGWRMHFSGQQGGVPAFREALAAWTAIPFSQVDYSFDGLTTAVGVLRSPDDVNTLMFGDPYDDIPGVFNGSGILALGGPWFYCEHSEYQGLEFHEISEGDIVVQEGVPEAFAATKWPDRLMVQLLSHELGHTLGFGHSDVADALMQASLHVDSRGAAFEPDDLAALDFLYAEVAGPATAPPAPAKPIAVSGRGPFVQLTWNPVTRAVNYRIERRQVPGPWELLTSVVATEFEDVFVEPQGVYEYRLRAQNAVGASAASPKVRVTAGEDGSPSSPSQLRHYPLDESGIGLRWQNNSCDAEMLRLEVSAGEIFRDLQTTIDGTRTEVLVTGLQPTDSYRFRVSAQNRWGVSPPSEAVEVAARSLERTCTWAPGAAHLCLDDRRFELSAEYWDEAGEFWRPATPRPDEDRQGFFSFFGTGNLELAVSVEVSESGVTSLQWTSLTDRAWRGEVTDTITGETWTVQPGVPLCSGSQALMADDSAPQDLVGPMPVEGSTSTVKGLATIKATDPTVPCGRSPFDLYLEGGRFRARLVWWEPGGVQHQARALDLTDATGGFELETTDELGWMVKVLDGRAVNGSFWVFASPLHASAAYAAELELTDLETGNTRTYGRPLPTTNTVAPCGVGDIGAFRE